MADDAHGDAEVKLTELSELTHLAQLFDRLRMGRHICIEDGALYLALRGGFEAYRTVFEALGFELIQHVQGFYFFLSEEELGKNASRMAVFFWVLIEAWGDQGHDLERKVFDRAGHSLVDLPHFKRESWRQCMADVGVSTTDELTLVVRRLEQYGFAKRLTGERLRFMKPAWRFLELSIDVIAESDQEPVGYNVNTESWEP